MNSLVSIIIPTYNRAHLIKETLHSVLNQTYSNWECIIIDDGSTDNSEEVIAKFIEKDSRIYYYKLPKDLKKGAPAARNYGFSKCKGQYVNWFDSDDLMHPNKIEIDLKHIINSDYDFTISQSDFFNTNGLINEKKWNEKLWSHNPINDFILSKIGWGINSPLWRKASLLKYSLTFNEKLITANDYLYHIQAMQFGFEPIIINETLVSQREHSNQLRNHMLKAPSKLLVNNYLYLNRVELKLETQVISFLNRQYIKQFSNLIKKNKMSQACYYFFKSLRLNYNFKTKVKLFKLLIIGVFYSIFGIGYKYLR